MPDLRRIDREIRQCRSDKEATINVEPVQDNLCHLKGSFRGPEGTPYEGGVFVVDIQLPPDYPFRPPKMKFDTPIYHPNISSQTGAICLDILKDAWSPVLTLKTALISLQSLLCDPAPNDPQDAQVARHYLTDRTGFENTARHWTAMYASPGAKTGGHVRPDAVNRIAEMGFDEKLIVKALIHAEGDEARAVDALVSGTIN